MNEKDFTSLIRNTMDRQMRAAAEALWADFTASAEKDGERREQQHRDYWAKHVRVKADQLRGSQTIVEYTGRREKTYRIARVDPPRGRLDRTVRVHIIGGPSWAYHPGDEVLVLR